MLISIWLYISYFCADNLAFIKFVIPKIVYSYNNSYCLLYVEGEYNSSLAIAHNFKDHTTIPNTRHALTGL